MTSPPPPREEDWIDYLAGEMAEGRRIRFENWLEQHPEAAEELRDLHHIAAETALLPLPEIPESELAAARQGVMAALDRQTPLREPPVLARLTRLAWIPASIAALFVGLLLGRLDPGSRSALTPTTAAGGGAPVDGMVEAGSGAAPLRRQVDVQGLAVGPDQGVHILLRETSSYEINGSTTDLDVQNTLSYIVRNDHDPGRRQQAVQLLEQHCAGPEACQILVYAMTQDPVAAVRREAALALQDHQQDPLVRQSFIKMLVEDPAQDLRRLAKGILAADPDKRQPLGR
jgi:hypothetical protein